MRILSVLCLIAIVMQFACNKAGNECPPSQEIEITHNGPQIVVGTPLILTTYQAYLMYRWSGPNGWKFEPGTLSNFHHHQELPPLTMEDAGEYKVELLN